jgi:hypothetical protein
VTVLLAGACALALVLWLVRRSRPDLRIGVPIAVAFGVRILVATGLGQTNIAPELRGGDETTFLFRGQATAAEPLFGSDSLDKLISQLHTFLISIHHRLLDVTVPENMLRFEMITFAVIGILLLSAAVYELAGPRAALLAAWILAFEPAHVFFSGLIHKEPLMFMAEALVVFGGAVLWQRGKLLALVPLVLGCLIAVATRPYVGWFLAAAAAVVVLHAALTRQRGLRSMALGATVVLLVAAFIPIVWEASSDENLKELQASQDANAADEEANLSLERVDYSTRENLILNLPQRVYDVTFKPYAWQAENTSQQLGILGTLIVLTCLVLLSQALWRNRKAAMQRAGPIIYPAAFMLAAYSLSAGNAGTSFRYRTHIVALALCLVIVLREHRWDTQRAAAPTYRRSTLHSAPERQPVA